MSTERDYQKLYDRLLEEVGALHRANQHRIRSGLRALLAVTVGLMLLMFLAGGNKVFTLMLWILSMFAVAAYLVAVEYMDYELQKKLRSIAQLEESAFGGLMNVPELPAIPALPRLLRRAAPEESAAPEEPAAIEESASPAEPAPAQETAPAAEPASPQEPAAPGGAALPAGWARVLEDPARLAEDLELLTRALQGLSDDLRRSAAQQKDGEADR